MKRIFFILVAICFSTIYCDAQSKFTRNQVGINASKFIVFFDEQVSNLDISYRYALDSIYSLRSSVSLGYTSDENAISDVALRIGADKQFLSSKNWRFYTGVDLSYTYSTINNADKNTQNFGALFLLGFMLKLGNHFSFSSEPSLSVLRYSTKDDQSFNPKANRKWTEIQFLNIGQINMNFHF